MSNIVMIRCFTSSLRELWKLDDGMFLGIDSSPTG